MSATFEICKQRPKKRPIETRFNFDDWPRDGHYLEGFFESLLVPSPASVGGFGTLEPTYIQKQV